MTAQKLYGMLKFLETLDKKSELQSKLEAVKNALTNIVNQPAQPANQSALATALAEFDKAAALLRDSINPSQFAAIEAMGGAEFFDPNIAQQLRASVQQNAMTPSVARDFVQELAKRRSEFLATVHSARQSLEELGITESTIEPGSADIAFLIPRDIFDNQLAPFAKELTFISRLLEHFGEALTGEPEQAELEQLSSSIPTIALVASVPVISAVGVVVHKFLEAWEKIEKIRKIRAEITEIGMKGTAVEELTEQITTTVDEVVEESTGLVLAHYQGSPDRRNELANAIHRDTRRLFGQIERGLKVEFRARPQKDGEAEAQKALTSISDLSRVIKFPEVAPEPMLLKSGEVIEGDIQTFKQSRKTTTHKTTTVKKGTRKDEVSTEETKV